MTLIDRAELQKLTISRRKSLPLKAFVPYRLAKDLSLSRYEPSDCIAWLEETDQQNFTDFRDLDQYEDL